MELTDKQRKTVARLEKDFGKDFIKAKSRDKLTGFMKVEAKSQAGVHIWVFDADGKFVVSQGMAQRLFG